VIEDANYDGSNPYDTDQYFENEQDSHPQQNWIVEPNPTQQIQDKFSEINLLDFDQPVTTNNNTLNNDFQNNYNSLSQNNSKVANNNFNNPFNNSTADQIDLL